MHPGRGLGQGKELDRHFRRAYSAGNGQGVTRRDDFITACMQNQQGFGNFFQLLRNGFKPLDKTVQLRQETDAVVTAPGRESAGREDQRRLSASADEGV